MNIHEYQAKEVLRGFGAPVPRGKAAFTVEEAVAAAEELPRPGLGGEGADPCRRPRQGRRRQGGQVHRGCGKGSQAHAGHDAGHASDRPAWPRSKAPLYRGRLGDRRASFIFPPWSTAPPAASPSSSPPKAAWISKKWRTRRRRRSTTFQIEPAAGYSPYIGNQIAAALKLKGDAAKQMRRAWSRASTTPSSPRT